jgi:biopolymer transport protein ExbB/TolQ
LIKTIQYTLNTRVFIKTRIKYVRKKIRKRFDINQFVDESINQDDQKKLFNKKFNVENQLNRKSLNESDSDDVENSTKISTFETFTNERAFYKLVNC